ncbi:cytochrome c peroxidase [Photobacterium sp. 2_MG-2023]|uniref:cytochrome-c peroxidase n=1 Tax=Photobacterium TaxID=657 RepID=UPI0026E48F4B|nr:MULTISPECIES: cytochrome c peroxidase [Photobacterium]MDO6583071.1 cytochrome c peroxidase [Photobacterium sp. 2_MG-2023]
MEKSRKAMRFGALGCTIACFSLGAVFFAQSEIPAEEPEPIESLIPEALTNLQVPLPDLTGIVRDKNIAIKLGKAFFWDQQVGSDGQACASCHFKAGADGRITNILTPGLLRVDANGNPDPDTEFGGTVPPSPVATDGFTASNQVARANITLTPDDFPFHQLVDKDDRNSAIVYSTNDSATSPGTFDGSFGTVIPRDLNEYCGDPEGSIFHTQSNLATRKVEPRNTPTVINAAFNFRNFWDGRANNIFNGTDPFGRRNEQARVMILNGRTPELARIDLNNASLASQAVGPTLSDFEMSCAGRQFADVGRRIVSLRPLAQQDIANNDSHLSDLVHPSGKGLRTSYAQLIRMAFEPQYWAARGNFVIDNSGSEPMLVSDSQGYTQTEINFSLFWGIAIMLYEAELISDDTAFDRFRGCHEPSCSPAIEPNENALSEQEKQGLMVFVDKGKCVNCHKGPEFTSAAVHLQAENQEEGLVERMIMGDNQVALYDNGFYNIGVKPTKEDLGVGAVDPWGNPLSFTRQYFDILLGNNAPDPFEVDPCTFEVPVLNDFPCNSAQQTNALRDRVIAGLERDAVDGAFKTPGLRNIALTAPYFHNGGAATLEQVVEFYNRGGNRRGSESNNNSGFGNNDSNLDPDIRPLGLTSQEQADLVAFLKTLTDERVRCAQAPFDHPSLTVSNGHLDQDSNNDNRADDILITLPAVGASGLPFSKCWANSGDLFNQGGPL